MTEKKTPNPHERENLSYQGGLFLAWVFELSIEARQREMEKNIHSSGLPFGFILVVVVSDTCVPILLDHGRRSASKFSSSLCRGEQVQV